MLRVSGSQARKRLVARNGHHTYAKPGVYGTRPHARAAILTSLYHYLLVLYAHDLNTAERGRSQLLLLREPLPMFRCPGLPVFPHHLITSV